MSTEHASFVIDRRLPGSPAHAFRFWSELKLKRRWTDCHPDWTVLEDRLDFRVGGSEVTRWRMPDGTELSFHADYQHIVPRQRIVYAYRMSFPEPVSVSLVTVEFAAEGGATLMRFTEQAVFLGAQSAAERRQGTAETFDTLIAVMEQELAGVQ